MVDVLLQARWSEETERNCPDWAVHYKQHTIEEDWQKRTKGGLAMQSGEVTGSTKRVRFKDTNILTEGLVDQAQPPIQAGKVPVIVLAVPSLEEADAAEQQHKPEHDEATGSIGGPDSHGEGADAILEDEYSQEEGEGILEGPPFRLGKSSSDVTLRMRRQQILGASCGTPKPPPVTNDDDRPSYFRSDSF